MSTLHAPHINPDYVSAFTFLFAGEENPSRREVDSFVEKIPCTEISAFFQGIFNAHVDEVVRKKMLMSVFRVGDIASLLTHFYSQYYKITGDVSCITDRNIRKFGLKFFLQTFMERCDRIPYVDAGHLGDLLSNLDVHDFYNLFEGVIRSTASLNDRKRAVQEIAKRKPSKIVTDSYSNPRDEDSDDTGVIRNLIVAINSET